MPDEQDTPMPEPSPEEVNEAAASQSDEAQEDTQQPEAEQPAADAVADAESEAETQPEDEPEATAEASDDGDGPSDEEAAALAAAMAAINQVQGVADSAASEPVAPAAQTQPATSDAQPYAAPELTGTAVGGSQNQVDLLSDVHMDVRIELGRTRMFVEDVLRLGDGAVVELDKLAGDPVDVFVNDRRVARGEVLVLNDMFCVRINEIVDITQNED